MPELPEVETVARGLRDALPGRTILSVRLGKTDFIDDPAALERELPSAKFLEVRRYGKFLGLRLEAAADRGAARSFFLFVHLGMTGQLVTRDPREPVAKHTHVLLALDDGRELRYTDPRRFGRMLLVPEVQLEAFVGHLGLEPLEMSERDFRARLSGRRAMIKALLLDQRVFRGLGNIYTDESLYRARIHPRHIAAKLEDAHLRALYRAMQRVLRAAIRGRGSSISDYVDSNGERGGFQIRLRAYDREGKPCAKCGEKIRRVIVAGRSSYFCPRCQRAPRVSRRARRVMVQRKRSRLAPAAQNAAA